MRQLRYSTSCILGCIFAASCFLCSCPTGLQSGQLQEEDSLSSGKVDLESQSIPDIEDVPSPVIDTSQFSAAQRKKIIFERLLNAVVTFEKTAVHEFGISSRNQVGGGEDIKLDSEFLKQYPFIFHLIEDGSISYNYNPRNEYELTKYVHSNFDAYFTAFESALEECYSRVREVISDAEIAYVLHNALIERTGYDFAIHAADTFGALIKGKAICQGYSLVYRQLLCGLGINTGCMFGPLRKDPNGHMWNSVALDGHCASTWDDNGIASDRALSSSFGKYFLTSDHEFYTMQQHSPSEADAQPKACVNTRYDSEHAVCRNGKEKTEPVYHNGYWYYISYTDRCIYRSNFDGSDKKCIYRFQYPALTKKNWYSFVYNELEVGKQHLYFVDGDPDNVKEKAIYSIGYDRGAIVKHILIAFLDLAQDKLVSLLPASDWLVITKGKNALRSELFLAKMKDTYYHGIEDYVKPEAGIRVTFIDYDQYSRTYAPAKYGIRTRICSDV